MLSQKLQDDLMSAYQQVYEAKRGHAAGDSDVEKQASQLASDVKYKAKGKVKEGASEEERKKVFMSILAASPAPNAVKAMARQKLLGEEVVHEERFTDGPEGTKKRLKALAKKRKMSMSKMKDHPQFQPESFSKTGMTKGTGKPSGAMKKYLDNAKKMQEADKKKKKTGNPAFDDPSHHSFRKSQYNSYEPQGEVVEAKVDKLLPSGPFFGGAKERAEARNKRKFGKKDSGIDVPYKRGNKYNPMSSPGGSTEYFSAERGKETAAKRGVKKVKGVKEDVEQVNEMGGMKVKQVVKTKPPKNEKDMSKEPGQKAPVDYRTLAQSHVPVGNIFNEKKMDPVGQEDGDINNDGKKDGTDKYLMNRRKAIGKAIAKKRGRVKEGFSAWRVELDFNEQVKK